MELKDLILSTLAELEKNTESDDAENVRQRTQEYIAEKKEAAENLQTEEMEIPSIKENTAKEELQNFAAKFANESEAEQKAPSTEETRFLTSLRERILVLFEGLQSPNNTKLESKVDLIINFLEYQLSVIDERLESKNAKNR